MSIYRTIFITLLLAAAGELVIAQGGNNVQYIGQLKTRGTNGYSQCWGYNAPNGKEYAIIGCLTGTQIVDITSDTLKEVAFIPGPQSGWREMKVYQHYAYIVTEGTGAGLQIIDLDSMKLVKTITTTQVPSGHTISIEGKYLYISGSRYKSGGIVVLDLTNPIDPVVVGEYQSLYVHDCVIKNDTIYAAAINGQGLDIIDAKDKANIKRVSLTNYPYSGTHNTDLSEDKRYVYTTDEINSNPNKNGNLLRVWDRSDITNLKLVGSYVARPNTIVHNIHVKGKFGYLAHYSEGLRILDLKYPEIPIEVGYYDTFIGSANNYVGAWGTFPYFNSNKVVISDMSGGLFVIRFAGQNGSIKTARTIITVVDSATNQPISDVMVNIFGRTEQLLTDGEGKIRIGAVVDTLTATFSKSTYSTGYITKSQKITMQYDTLVNWTVKLKQGASGSLKVNVKSKTLLKALKNFRIKIPNTPVAGVTDTAGIFMVPSLLGGTTFTVIAAQWGFLPETAAVNITGGIENTVNFQLTPNALDNFEGDLGWTVGTSKDIGTTGIWVRSAATAAVVGTDTLQPAFDHSPVGNKLYVTGASDAPTDYVSGRTTLTSPTFDPSAFASPSVLYWIFFNSRSAAKDDTLYVDVSNNSGATWKNAAAINGKQPFWKQYKLDLKSVMTVTDQMQIRFTAVNGGASSIFDVSIDDLEFGNNLQLSAGRTGSSIPSAYALEQNYPNPFNPATSIEFSLPVQSHVTLKIFDVLGREVKTLINEQHSAGVVTVVWNGTNALGQQVESGTYFYTMKAGDIVQTRKMVLLK